MPSGYVRQSSGVIITGNTVQASHFNNEFNTLEAFADASTGHNHDGTIGGGAKITPAGLTGVSADGIIVRASSSSFVARTLTAPAAGITVTNGTGVSGNPTLGLANDLAALEGLSATGIAVRTGSDTWAQRSILAGSNISVTNGNGVSGDITIAATGLQPSDATLTALAGYNTNGLLTQTASDTFTGRTLTGTAGTITVTNGDGVSGNPTVTIDSGYVGQTSITTLGTITTGTWNAGVIAGQYGGTGVNNAGKTITLGGNFTTSGAFAATLTLTNNTTVTLPTTGTLATLAGSETLTNKTLTSPILTTPSLGVATATSISFGGTALANYEEGTFTPTLYGSTTAGTPTYTEQSGYYTRIGNRCFFEAACIISAIGGAVGQIRFDGLPFVLPNTLGKRASCSVSGVQGISMGAAPNILAQILNNTNDVALSVTSTTGTNSLLWTDATATFGIRVSGQYILT